MNFANIHPFLRERCKWAVWRYETAEGRAKPTKPPRSPVQPNNPLISPTDDTGWGTFDEAVAAYGNGTWWNGIGYRIDAALNLAVIDLDYSEGMAGDVRVAHKRIYDRLASYTEFSPSQQGLHIITFGKVPNIKRGAWGVEVYCSDRFMTATGNTLYDGDIVLRQAELEELVNDLGGEIEQKGTGIDYSAPALEQDSDIIAKAHGATNGPKFAQLWAGEWTAGGYASQSEADFALVNMLCYYTRNVEQVRRLFFASGLGQRDKLRNRPDLLEGLIKRGYDRIIPPMDFTALRLHLEQKLGQAQAGLTVPEAVSPRGVTMEPLPPPPGLFGEVARWFYDAASYPAPEIALAGAIGFMSGLCGAGWNVNGAGLNTFTLLTAPSTAGKDVLTSGANRLIAACREFKPENHNNALNLDNLASLIGPRSIASGSALTKALTGDFISTVSIQSEFYHVLSSFANPNANGSTQQLKAMYLELIGRSGKNETLGGDIWADKDKNTKPRRAVAFSLLGESTPERVYESISVDQITDGFLGRMLLIEVPFARMDYNPNGPRLIPSPDLVAKVRRVAVQAYANCRNMAPVDVETAPEAFGILDDYRVSCRLKHTGEGKPAYAALWGRCHVKAIRLAALVAVGLNPEKPLITPECADWAIKLVNRGTEVILGRVDRGEIGQDSHTGRVSKLETFLIDYVTKSADEQAQAKLDHKSHAIRQISFAYIRKHVGRLVEYSKDERLLTNAIKTLLQDGSLVPADKRADFMGPNKPGEVYQITDKILDK